MLSNKVWQCPAGNFSGWETQYCVHVTGIRYAKAARFGNPEPFVYSSGVHKCLQPSPFGLQLFSRFDSNTFGMHYTDVFQTEECQFLSITMPKNVKTDSNLPVMVWFHGGGYRNGGCDARYNDFEPLAANENVIVVGVNYRLSVSGFIRNRQGELANCGLLDAIEGLRWAKNNIQGFGGNPDKITIFGESSGADLVRAIMLSKGTDDLYKRAIIQSDPIGTMNNRNFLEERFLDVADKISLDAPAEKLLEVQDFLTNNIPIKGLAKLMIFAPHYGVYPLPSSKNIDDRLKQVAQKHDLLIGTNKREAATYIGYRPMASLADTLKWTKKPLEKVISKFTEVVFTRPTQELAKKYSSFGGKVYLYNFYWMADQSVIGSGHAMDLLPLFGAKNLKGMYVTMGKTVQQIYDAGKPMRKAWGDFAKNGLIHTKSIAGMIDFNKLG